MAGRNGSVIALSDARFRRIDKRLEALERSATGTNARLDAINTRLDDAVGVLTRLVRVVAAQNERTNRNFARLSDRIGAMTRATMTGRTRDSRRLSRIERRFDVVERRLSLPGRRPI